MAKNMTIFRPKVTTNVVHYNGCVACIHDNKIVILSVVGHVGVVCFIGDGERENYLPRVLD